MQFYQGNVTGYVEASQMARPGLMRQLKNIVTSFKNSSKYILLHHAAAHRGSRSGGSTGTVPEIPAARHVAEHPRVVREADHWHCTQLTLHLRHHAGHKGTTHRVCGYCRHVAVDRTHHAAVTVHIHAASVVHHLSRLSSHQTSHLLGFGMHSLVLGCVRS